MLLDGLEEEEGDELVVNKRHKSQDAMGLRLSLAPILGLRLG